MIYELTTNSYIQLFTAIAAITTSAILWRYKQAKEVRFLIILEFFVAIWALCYAVESSTPVFEIKIRSSQLSYIGIAFIPAFYFFFTTAFSQKWSILSKKTMGLVMIIPVFTLFLALPIKSHNLIWTDVSISPETGFVIYKHGIWFWIFYIHAALMYCWGLYNLISSIYEFTNYYHSQITMLVVASVIPIIANLVYLTGLNPYPGFDWTPVSFVFTGLAVSFGVIRLRMFELVPLARRKLIDTMGEGVAVINSEGFIEDSNPAFNAIFNVPSTKAQENDIHKIFTTHPEIIEEFDSPEKQEISIQHKKNGIVNHYQIKFTPIYNRNNKFTGNLMILSDITSIRKTEEKLKLSNVELKKEIKRNEVLIEELDAYAHTLAHDIKNQLGTIYSSCEVLQEGIEDDNKKLLMDFSQLIRESASETIKTTNELLKMATSGYEDVEKTSLNMPAIIQQALKELKDLIVDYGAEIVFAQSWEKAVGYPAWIKEVWINYLGNAIKYGGTPPIIEMGSEQTENNMVKFWVKDNGDGIAPELQHKLFKKHTRLNPDKVLGYGLGLSIVKRIIEKLGGSVGIESTGQPGEGTIFYFMLPGE